MKKKTKKRKEKIVLGKVNGAESVVCPYCKKGWIRAWTNITFDKKGKNSGNL